MWTWCSACQHSAHSWYRLPKWWKNLEEIDYEKLASYPDYLEKNKMIIDEWINKFVGDWEINENAHYGRNCGAD